KLRASLAATQAQADRIEALGAVRLRDEAIVRGIHPDIASQWAKAGPSTTAFRAPGAVWCVRGEAQFAAELEHCRCSWPDCPRFALNAARRCHEHAGCVERGGRSRLRSSLGSTSSTSDICSRGSRLVSSPLSGSSAADAPLPG